MLDQMMRLLEGTVKRHEWPKPRARAAGFIRGIGKEHEKNVIKRVPALCTQNGETNLSSIGHRLPYRFQ